MKSMGRTELSPLERERRLNIILEASKKVFITKGYFNATMGDIASESALSRRTIYLYFKNKDDLTYEIVYRAFTSLKKMVLEASETNKSGYDRLIDIKDGYIDYFNNNFADLTFTMFFDFKINTNNIEDGQIKECFFIISKVVIIIKNCLDIGIKDGSIRNNIKDTKRTSIAAINIIHATMQKLAIRKDIIEITAQYSSNELIDEMFDLFFQSIKN